MKYHIKFIQLFNNQLQFSKHNAKEEDGKFFFVLVCQFDIYSQILLGIVLSHFAGPHKTTLAIYQECLIELFIKYTFNLVQFFYFAFY